VRLSVVLATYQGERFLPALLQSLAAQERPPDELIVRDDASTDTSVELVEAFAARAGFPVVLERNERNRGSTVAFGQALGRAEGDIVALCDQDDRWYPHKLARLYQEFDERPDLAMVFSNADLIDAYDVALKRSLWHARGLPAHFTAARRLGASVPVSPRLLAQRPLVTGCTMAVSRAVLDAALPFPEHLDAREALLRHDRWLSLLALSEGGVRAVPEPLIAFRVHPDQQTGLLVGRRRRLRANVQAVESVLQTGITRAADRHRTRALQLEAAAARAEAEGDHEGAARLHDAAEHHRVRATLPTGRGRRALVVAGELARGRYGRDLLALESATGDIVRRP